MIRISRGAEPPALIRARRKRLSQAILDRDAGKTIAFEGYDVVKEELAEALNRKCVFCEMALRTEGSPVEHFRPKACVANEGAPVDESRYWWLAWTWGNLLFACVRCNSSYKRNQFPLEPNTPALPERSFDLGLERPLLINPARIDPRDHIRFKWSENRKRWVPVPIRGSKTGLKTIATLGLDDDDRPTAHIQERVEPLMKEIEERISGGNRQAIQRTWKRILDSLFAKHQPFHAVTWDALNARFPAKLRRGWGLDLPDLGSHGSESPSFDFKDPPEFSLLPEELQLRVRTLENHALSDDFKKILKKVLQLRTWTDAELARLFGRREATIRFYRRRLRSRRPPI